MVDPESIPDPFETAPNCKKFLDVWQQWRGDRILPTRDDVRPEMLGKSLSAITILEIRAPDNIKIRMVPSDVEELTDHYKAGENFVDLVAPDERRIRIQRYQNLVRVPCGAFSNVRIPSKHKLALNLVGLLFPVIEFEGQPPRFIYGAIEFLDDRDLLKDTDKLEYVPISRNFQYVDIGCGLPEPCNHG